MLASISLRTPERKKKMLLRRGWVIPLFLALAFCTHVHRIAFDNTDNSFVLAGNRHASQKDFDDEAQQYCQTGKPVLLACGEGTAATITSTSSAYSSQGGWAHGSGTTTVNKNDAQRCQYQCR
jgi:hypothetical protein